MKQLASESKTDTENFEREMNILYNLPPHPNIVRCTYFLVTPLVIASS